MASRLQKKKKKTKKRKGSPLGRLFRTLYGTVVVLSAIVVVGFCAFRVWAAPPKQADTPPMASRPVTAKPSDNPNTLEDESLATPQPLVRQDQVYTFLLAASDVGGGNADTIMVVKFDIPNQTVGVVSIMRDTMTEQYSKINAAYADGVEALRDTTADMLGIPIDYYVTVNIRAFKALVNAVDGVDFYIPCSMNYDDTTPGQELRIHYNEGMQHLNGQQALEVVRFRHNNDGSGYTDVGRAQTQRDLLVTVAKKIFKPSSLFKLDQFLQIFEQNVKTDLSASNLAFFAYAAKDVDLTSGITMTSLPGETFGNKYYQGKSWCWQLYPQESLDIVNEVLNPYTTPMTMDTVNFIQAW